MGSIISARDVGGRTAFSLSSRMTLIYALHFLVIGRLESRAEKNIQLRIFFVSKRSVGSVFTGNFVFCARCVEDGPDELIKGINARSWRRVGNNLGHKEAGNNKKAIFYGLGAGIMTSYS